MTAAITRTTAIVNNCNKKYENVICKGDGNKQKKATMERQQWQQP